MGHQSNKHSNKDEKKKSKKKTNATKHATSTNKLYDPYNQLRIGNPKDKLNTRSTSSPLHRKKVLSVKETAYISSCFHHHRKYKFLKDTVMRAVNDNKIFSIHGSGNGVASVRKALKERGWIEKIQANKINLMKVKSCTDTNKANEEMERIFMSNLIGKTTPNFIWYTHEVNNNNRTPKDNRIIKNKLEVDGLWVTKHGLCSSMKIDYWFYIEGQAEVNSPRTYNSDAGGFEDFVSDYKITACTSLLKWVLSMVANNREIFTEAGKISIDIFLFALNRCKEYLQKKQNEDIDKPVPNIKAAQWAAYLRQYYCLIAEEDVFEIDKNNVLPMYFEYSKLFLKEIHKYRPQLSCEGCLDIWIVKPGCCSRGRGIRLASKLEVISNLLSNTNTKYVIQKYIEEPLLVHNTKFDIRQYYLVTCTFPLVIWMYMDCYLKFSSQNYNLRNYHESIHLTNNAVQKKYINCLDRHKDLPKNNMWSLEEYKKYLNTIDRNTVWDEVIYPGMKKCIIGVMLNGQNRIMGNKNRFELYGCDYVLDNDYKPWLIEINSNPDLNNTTEVTAQICPEVISDIIKVIIDYPKNKKASTGKFHRIFDQPCTPPHYGIASDLMVRGVALPVDYFNTKPVETEINS